MLSETELQKKYGIGVAEWQRMFQAQGGKCAICRCQQRYQSLAVDHDHKTKMVRGLLCVNCNRGLGRFFDSELRMKNGYEYLRKANEKQRELKALAQSKSSSAAENQLAMRPEAIV